MVWNRFSAAGREAARLERELREVELRMETAPSAKKTPATTMITPTASEVFGPVGHRRGHVRRRRRTANASWRI